MDLSERLKFVANANNNKPGRKSVNSVGINADIVTLNRSNETGSTLYKEVEIARLGCKKCLRSCIDLKTTSALENVSVDDDKISLVTIDEESVVCDTKPVTVFPKGDSNKENFSLIISRVMPSVDLAACKKDGVEEFFLKWNFLDKSDSLPFFSNYTLNFSKVYPFEITKFNYLYMSRCTLPIELWAIYRGKSECTLLGRADVEFKNALDNIGTACEGTLAINNKDLMLCYKNLTKKHFGQLVCSYMFSGLQSRFDDCKPEIIDTSSVESLPSTNVNICDETESCYNLVSVKSTELKAFQDGLNLVLVRNKALRTRQEEIVEELCERTTWMHEELKWRLTLQEHAILRGNDPHKVKWRQWKDETTSNVKYRPYASQNYSKNHLAVFEINVVELQLNPFSHVFNNESITQIYIEYSFLHMSGQQLETASKIKPMDDQPIVYNFIKTFEIRKGDKEAKQLAEMIRNNDVITFTAVSEPRPDPNDCQNCVQIGHCYVSMFDLVENLKDVVVDYYPIYDEQDGERELGRLKLIFGGVLSLRAIALQVMTPNSFKIIR